MNPNLAGHPFFIFASHEGVLDKLRSPGFINTKVSSFSNLVFLIVIHCPYTVLFASRIVALGIRSSLSINWVLAV
ncbi:MAG: hypothetical protein CTY19_07535 [Methylomonas sp.]|nr:MAG: hypothetical protein CTY19_07535 [Methylomonas sp.]